MNDEVHLTPNELAKRLNVHVVSLARWRAEGKGPAFVKLGVGRTARVRYPLSFILEWENSNVKQ